MQRSVLLLVLLLGGFVNLRAQEIPREFPKTVQNLSLWLKADEGVSFHEGLANGTVVRDWRSKVGNLTAAQDADSASTRAAVLKAEGLKSTIQFRGNSTLRVPSAFNLKNSTVFVSIKHGRGQPYERILSFPPVNDGVAHDFNNPAGLTFFINRETGYQATLQSNNPADNLLLNPNPPLYSTGNWTSLGYRIDAGGNMTVSANGTPGKTVRSEQMTPRNSGNQLLIGYSLRQNVAENLAAAEIYEILVFDRALSDQENSDVGAYMRASMNATVPVLNEKPVAGPVARNVKLSSSPLTGGRVVAGDNSTVTGNFTWTKPETVVASSGNQSVTFVPDFANHTHLEFPVFVTVKPELAVTPAILNFSAVSGIASEKRSVRIEGYNLTSPNLVLDLRAAKTFEMSMDSQSYSAQLSIPVQEGAVSKEVFIRVSENAEVGNHTASLSLSSGNTTASVTLNAIVFGEGSRVLGVDPLTLDNFFSDSGNPSAARPIFVEGYNLTANITVDTTAGWELSTDNSTFSRVVQLPVGPIGVSANGTVFVRLLGTGNAGFVNGTVTFRSGVDLVRDVALGGNRTAPKQAPTPTPAPPSPVNPPAESQTVDQSKNKGGSGSKGKKKKGNRKKKPSGVFTNTSSKRKGVGAVPVAQSVGTVILSNGSVVAPGL